MSYRSLLAAVALSAVPFVPTAGAQIFDYGKYPDLRGQWVRGLTGPFGCELERALGERDFPLVKSPSEKSGLTS